MSRKPTPAEFQERALRAFVVLAAPIACVAAACVLAWYAARTGAGAARLVLGQLGRPFGKRWFRSARRVTWKTNFRAMPADDAALAAWLAGRPGVDAPSVTREPYWVTFDCVLRGYFLRPGELRTASTAAARALGYDTGAGLSIVEVRG